MRAESHEDVWRALDRLASEIGLSPSGLAKKAGLDPTAFNPSKRNSSSGRPHWPTMESIFKVLHATDRSLFDFARLAEASPPGMSDQDQTRLEVPVLGYAEAGSESDIEDTAQARDSQRKSIFFPTQSDQDYLALAVQGDSMAPLYRDGDMLIVSPSARIVPGDRLVVRTRQGEVMVKTLKSRSSDTIVLGSVNPDYETQSFAADEVQWLAKIVWASQ